MKIEFGRVNIIGDIKENARIILTIILGTKWLALAVIIVTLIICDYFVEMVCKSEKTGLFCYRKFRDCA